MTKRNRTTTAEHTASEEQPARPLTLLEQVAEERRLHSERSDALLAEAAAIARQHEEDAACLPTMERLQATIAGQHRELAQARDLAARVAADARQMKELSLETAGGEQEA